MGVVFLFLLQIFHMSVPMSFRVSAVSWLWSDMPRPEVELFSVNILLSRQGCVCAALSGGHLLVDRVKAAGGYSGTDLRFRQA